MKGWQCSQVQMQSLAVELEVELVAVEVTGVAVLAGLVLVY